MAGLDIFEPQVSRVTRGLKGKTILLYGSNSTGKTKQASRAPKPFYLGFENGVNAISGVPFLPMEGKWSNFKKIRKQLTNPKTLQQAQDKYNTIIFDTVESSAQYCQDYLCLKHGVETIAEGNKGFGLWKEYETEYWKEINALTSVGYTVIFISHEGEKTFKDEKGEEYSKIYPKGDKRSIDPIIDLCDIVAYLKPNGLDENHNEIKSSAFFVNTPQFLSRSRFDYMVNFIQEFTIENLEKAIADAVAKEEEENGVDAVTTFEEKQESMQVQTLSFDELKKAIEPYALHAQSNNRIEDYMEITNEYLGSGVKVSETTKKQSQQLELVLSDLRDLFGELQV